MVKERVTREDLNNIRIGKSEIFTLPNYTQCKSAAVQAYQMGNIADMKFTCRIGDRMEGTAQRSITITRIS